MSNHTRLSKFSESKHQIYIPSPKKINLGLYGVLILKSDKWHAIAAPFSSPQTLPLLPLYPTSSTSSPVAVVRRLCRRRRPPPPAWPPPPRPPGPARGAPSSTRPPRNPPARCASPPLLLRLLLRKFWQVLRLFPLLLRLLRDGPAKLAPFSILWKWTAARCVERRGVVMLLLWLAGEWMKSKMAMGGWRVLCFFPCGVARGGLKKLLSWRSLMRERRPKSLPWVGSSALKNEAFTLH